MKKNTVFSTLQLVHKMMLGGQVMFTVIMFVLVQQQFLSPVAKEQEKILQVIVLVVTAATLIAGNKLFKKKLVDINSMSTTDAKTKLEQYRAATMLYWGITEVGSLVSGIAFLLTGNYAFLAVAALVMLYFGMLAPVKARVAEQLHFQTTDLDEL